MHSIKRAAHRDAWYHNNDGDTRTYNFWGRTDTRPKRQRDEENALHRYETENNAPSPIAERRRSRNLEEREGFGPPHHASTAPPDHPSANHNRLEIPKGGEIPEQNSSSEDSNEKSANIDSATATSDDHPQPRKRRGLKFWKKGEEDHSEEAEDKAEKKRKMKERTKHITVVSQLRVVFLTWINLFLIFVPVGIAVEYAGIPKVIVFVLNFLAIIPLAAILSFATEELALYIGEVLGGLLNATFGNAVELIVSIIALIQGKIIIVQTSLIGSMLSNLLLVMGMCFFFGGLGRKEQFFNVTVAQTAASLLALAIGSLIIPTAFRIFSGKAGNSGVAPLSRGTSVLLLVTYACYLLFQLSTHSDMYNEPSQKAPKKERKHKKRHEGEALKAMAKAGASHGAAPTGGQINQENLVHDENDSDEGEVPQLTRIGALVTLACSTVLIALCAEFMVSAIGAVAESISQEFIGLILLPIVGNAAEHATAVTVAIKMDLAIGVAVGSSLQIALLVLPLMVCFNWWGLGQGVHVDGKLAPDMTLSFDGFQIAVLFIAVIVVNYLIQDGKSHWLEGVLLQITYLIIAVAAWYYPVAQDLSG